MRVLRNGNVLATGKMASLKRFKDDAREVLTGYECGISVENFKRRDLFTGKSFIKRQKAGGKEDSGKDEGEVQHIYYGSGANKPLAAGKNRVFNSRREERSCQRGY